jgi:hypothetical protein
MFDNLPAWHEQRIIRGVWILETGFAYQEIHTRIIHSADINAFV